MLLHANPVVIRRKRDGCLIPRSGLDRPADRRESPGPEDRQTRVVGQLFLMELAACLVVMQIELEPIKGGDVPLGRRALMRDPVFLATGIQIVDPAVPGSCGLF